MAKKSDVPTAGPLEALLARRGTRYGPFPSHAQITQDLKMTMRDAPVWMLMAADQREALEMVAHKIGRILNGDPDYADSWRDIAGYTKLVADRLISTHPNNQD